MKGSQMVFDALNQFAMIFIFDTKTKVRSNCTGMIAGNI